MPRILKVWWGWCPKVEKWVLWMQPEFCYATIIFMEKA